MTGVLGEGSPRPAQPSRLSLLNPISPAPRPTASSAIFIRAIKAPSCRRHPHFLLVSQQEKEKPLTCELPACHRSQVRSCSPALGRVLPAWREKVLGMGSCWRQQGTSPEEPPQGEEMGLGALSWLSLSSSLLSHLYFLFLSDPLSSSLYFLPSFFSFFLFFHHLSPLYGASLTCPTLFGFPRQQVSSIHPPLGLYPRAVAAMRTPASSLEGLGREGRMGKGHSAACSTEPPSPERLCTCLASSPTCKT